MLPEDRTLNVHGTGKLSSNSICFPGASTLLLYEPTTTLRGWELTFLTTNTTSVPTLTFVTGMIIA